MTQAGVDAYRLVFWCRLARERDGRWPQLEDELARRPDLPQRDPWGAAWRLAITADTAVVRSCGGDGLYGTADDVVSPPAAARPAEPPAVTSARRRS